MLKENATRQHYAAYSIELDREKATRAECRHGRNRRYTPIELPSVGKQAEGMSCLYLLDPLRDATTSFSETNLSICVPRASPYFAFSSLRLSSEVLRSLTWS